MRMRLPSGVFYTTYRQDQALWPTTFVKLRMWGLLVFLFVIFPQIASSYWLSLASLVGYTILSAMGVQLLIGYTGQVTLGHAAFIAAGAYTVAVLVLQYHVPYPLAFLAALVVAGLWSVLFGLPSARVKGFYLIMTTMAAQFITVDFIITQYVSRIGERGHSFSLPPGTLSIGPWVLRSDRDIYYLMITLVTLSVLAMTNLARTRIGRAWMAIRDHDIAAEALGINIVAYKLLAFFMAGVFGGMAGAFWVASLFAVSPEHFAWSWSLWLVGVVLIGGLGSNYGTIFGSLFMTLVMEALRNGVAMLAPIVPALEASFLFVKEAAFGLAIVLFLLYEPNGLAYRWWQIKNYIHLWPFSYE
ncbi:branched-chain amino acid ABC transporter permease [Thermoflexus sp.]|uniref:branched-chain amino acid ABC transporter permease n=1 Tax=Thermoflexus sp. TaxID=1969742 RepID=UPI003321B5EF